MVLEYTVIGNKEKHYLPLTLDLYPAEIARQAENKVAVF
jgi:hypothetical protein